MILDLNPQETLSRERHWAMNDDAEVVELGGQLAQGLIHPLEYARNVQLIALKYGIQPYTGNPLEAV